MDKKEFTIEEKKRYLEEYRKSDIAVKRLEDDIREFKLIMYPSLSLQVSDMPKGGSNQKDLSNYLVKEESLLSRMMQERYKRIKLRTDIYQAIENMEDETEKAVLTYHYLQYKQCEDIAEIIFMSDRQVYRILKNAIKNFEPIVE